MTKITVSLIIAIIFIVATFSKPMIPCKDEQWDLCRLDGIHNYYGTNKLSNNWYSGGVTFIIVFLLSLAVLNLIFPKRVPLV